MYHASPCLLGICNCSCYVLNIISLPCFQSADRVALNDLGSIWRADKPVQNFRADAPSTSTPTTSFGSRINSRPFPVAETSYLCHICLLYITYSPIAHGGRSLLCVFPNVFPCFSHHDPTAIKCLELAPFESRNSFECCQHNLLTLCGRPIHVLALLYKFRLARIGCA